MANDPILKTPLEEPVVDAAAYDRLQEVVDLRKTPGGGNGSDERRRVDTSKLLVKLGKTAMSRERARRIAAKKDRPLSDEPPETSTTSYANYLIRSRTWFQRPELLIAAGIGGVVALGLVTYIVVYILH